MPDCGQFGVVCEYGHLRRFSGGRAPGGASRLQTTVTRDNEYVLGAHDEEVERLGLQHDLWRPYVEPLWKAAGVAAGETVLDVACGPGFAALDLAEIVGPTGRVVAVDRSERFLGVLKQEAARRGLRQVEAHLMDLNGPLGWPVSNVDVIWDRWGLAFVERPRETLASLKALLRPGGRLIFHEYEAYEMWQLTPKSARFDAFVASVIRAWRDAGGEPNIAGRMIGWLQDLGFTIEFARPVVEVLSIRDPLWQWPRAFVDTGLQRLVQLGAVTDEASRQTWEEFLAREAEPGTRMITPLVMQVIARR
jgi:SAM-dependent methyltransferase